jgi:hypothetical protein
LEHDIVFLGHSSSQPWKDWSALLIKGGAILLPAPPFLLPFPLPSYNSQRSWSISTGEIKLSREFEDSASFEELIK